jgi:hypothetical protein
MRFGGMTALAAAIVLCGCSHLPTNHSSSTAQGDVGGKRAESDSKSAGTGSNSGQSGGSTASHREATPPSDGAPAPQGGTPAGQSSGTKRSQKPASAGAVAAGASSQQPRSSGSKPTAPPSSSTSGTRPSGTTSTTASPDSKASAPKAGTSTPQSSNAANAGSARPAAPALDLAALEDRLKSTRAIGVFTKLSLKNQVDDLLGEFRTFHARKQPPLTELRQRYDLLLLKVLSLLQDGDPPLAAQISSSREALWDILTDPQKFARL